MGQFYRLVEFIEYDITEFEGGALYEEIREFRANEDVDAVQGELAVGFVEREEGMPQVDAVGDGSNVSEDSAVEDSAEEILGLGHAIEDNDGAGNSLKGDAEGQVPHTANANAEVGIEDEHEDRRGGDEGGVAEFVD